jgi:transposase-like protein
VERQFLKLKKSGFTGKICLLKTERSQMNPQEVFCPNMDCPARGQTGKGNIWVHSRKDERYKCTVCRRTFVATKGTPFYRTRTAPEIITQVVTLLAYGCPTQAIVAAFGVDERTVADWAARAGQHAQAVQEHLVERPRDLGQVQADELYAKVQGGKLWVAMILQVSTRLWLGGVIAARRDMALIRALASKLRACALPRPLLICVDGLAAYVRALRQAFRDPLPRDGRRGRCRLAPWRGLYIAQVIKRYSGRCVVSVTQRIVQGARHSVARLIAHSQGDGGINTAYIERLNATFRARLHHLVRRGRALAREDITLQRAMYLVGAVYNFCTCHDSLRVRRRGRPDKAGHRWLFRTPAMAAEITDHCWTVHELLSFHVPPPRWTPPKRRGRPSAEDIRLAQTWAT